MSTITQPKCLERTGTTLWEAARGDGIVDPTVDPKITATGGRRRRSGDAKSNYEWPGTTPQPDWIKTRVHRHSSYGCARCGKRFATPHGVYAHLAKVHGR